MYTIPTEESVYARVEHNEKGLTYIELQKLFFGAETPKPEDEKTLSDCIDANIDKGRIVMKTIKQPLEERYFKA